MSISYVFCKLQNKRTSIKIQILLEKGELAAELEILLEFKDHRQRKEQVRNKDKTAPSAPIQPRIQIRCHDDMVLPADFCLAMAYQSFWPEAPLHKGCDTALTILNRWSMHDPIVGGVTLWSPHLVTGADKKTPKLQPLIRGADLVTSSFENQETWFKFIFVAGT